MSRLRPYRHPCLIRRLASSNQLDATNHRDTLVLRVYRRTCGQKSPQKRCPLPGRNPGKTHKHFKSSLFHIKNNNFCSSMFGRCSRQAEKRMWHDALLYNRCCLWSTRKSPARNSKRTASPSLIQIQVPQKTDASRISDSRAICMMAAVGPQSPPGRIMPAKQP